MVVLTGESLGKRQRDLNRKVLETIQNQTKFEEIKSSEEISDVDRLYKIDVALHYKDIDYIVDTLKCGDSLYTTRVLKCSWLYDNEYSHIINPDYLHHEIFPHTSLKMKAKILHSIAAHIRCETRTALFFKYCSSLCMKQIALKFLLHSSESFKLDVIENYFDIISYEEKNLKYFIGSSFNLAKTFISKLPSQYAKESYIMQLSYLYSVNNELYLDMFEEYNKHETRIAFGGRISKSILIKHKLRVLRNPLLYIDKLNKYAISRNCTKQDVQKFIIALFPRKVNDFWSSDFYNNYKHLFDVIPSNETFIFLKNTFESIYGNEPFEMDVKFYRDEYFEMFSETEREQWALKHIDDGKELLGSNKDYIWYTFVNFEVAFPAIKKYIYLTTSEDERNHMVKVLIHSCRNESDLEKLFCYYYERHVNEFGHHKEGFIEEVLNNKNVLKFNSKIWQAFNAILYSMEVYTPGFYGKNNLRALCIIYNILHNIDLPEALTYYLDSGIDIGDFKCHLKMISEEEKLNVFNYLFDYYLNLFKNVDVNDLEDKRRKKVDVVKNLFTLLRCFKKPVEDLPSIINLFIDENIDDFRHLMPRESVKQVDLLRLLKKDKKLVIEKIPDIEKSMGDYSFRLTHLIQKIHIYFRHDLAPEFLNFFNNYMKNSKEYHGNARKTSMHAIYILADEQFKRQFLDNYKPLEAKIVHSKIDSRLLIIREVICRFAGYSRPLLPIECIIPYIKGDYVKFCVPMFNMYVANAPLSASNKFIESLLDKPISIQKHGIRLAFKVYSVEDTKTLIENIWKKTKNVSLRCVIFKDLVKRIKATKGNDRNEFYLLLKELILSVQENDDPKLLDPLFSRNFPRCYRSSLFESAWMSVKQLSNKKLKIVNMKYKLIDMINDASPMNRGFWKTEIIMEHVHNILCNREILKEFRHEEIDLHQAIWRLTATYIITCDDEAQLEESIVVLDLILQECFKNWNAGHKSKNVYVKFLHDFMEILEYCCHQNRNNCRYADNIFEKIFIAINENLPKHETFLLSLNIKLLVLVFKIVNEDIRGMEHIVKHASRSLLTFIEELQTGDLLPCFFSKISDLILKNVEVLVSLASESSSIVRANIAVELASNDNINAILFALSIMPIDNNLSEQESESFDKLKSVFEKKIMLVKNFAVQSYFYNKFLLSPMLH